MAEVREVIRLDADTSDLDAKIKDLENTIADTLIKAESLKLNFDTKDVDKATKDLSSFGELINKIEDSLNEFKGIDPSKLSPEAAKELAENIKLASEMIANLDNEYRALDNKLESSTIQDSFKKPIMDSRKELGSLMNETKDLFKNFETNGDLNALTESMLKVSEAYKSFLGEVRKAEDEGLTFSSKFTEDLEKISSGVSQFKSDYSKLIGEVIADSAEAQGKVESSIKSLESDFNNVDLSNLSNLTTSIETLKTSLDGFKNFADKTGIKEFDSFLQEGYKSLEEYNSRLESIKEASKDSFRNNVLDLANADLSKFNLQGNESLKNELIDIQNEAKNVSKGVADVRNAFSAFQSGNLSAEEMKNKLREAHNELQSLYNVLKSSSPDLASQLNISSLISDVKTLNENFKNEVSQVDNIASSFKSVEDNRILEDFKPRFEALKNSANELRDSVRTMFDTGDFSGLTDATNKLLSLRSEASELKNIINTMNSRGMDTSSYESVFNIIKSIRGELSSAEPLSALSNSLKNLDSETNTLKEDYNNIFKNGDFSNLNSANEKLRELQTRAVELNNIIANLSSQGVDTSIYEQQLESVQTKITTIATESSEKMKSKMIDSFKELSGNLKSIFSPAIKTTFDVAKSAFTTYLNFVKSALSSLFDGIKNNIKGLFSGGESSGLLSEIKSLLPALATGTLIKKSYDLSDTLINTEGTISFVFGELSDDIREWSDEYARRFAMTITEARGFALEFMTLFQNIGVGGKAGSELSKNMTALAGDLSSAYGITLQDASSKLESAISGNSRALRSMGILMDDATMKAYALSRGYRQNYEDMSNANKAIVRYNYLLGITARAHGNAATNLTNWTNSVKLLKANLVSLGQLIGGVLIKLLFPVVQVLNSIVAAAVNAGNALAKAFGFDAVSLSNLIGEGAASPESLGNVDDMSDALGDESKALDKVGKSAKKAGNNLQSFDKLNNTETSKNKSSGGSNKGMRLGTDGLLDFDSYYKKVPNVGKTPLEKWLDHFWKLIGDKKWKKAGQYLAEGLNNLVSKLRKKLQDPKVYKGIHNFNKALTEFYDGFLDFDTRELGGAFADGLNLVAYAINDLYKQAVKKNLLKRTGEKIADFFDGVVDDTKWKEVGKAFATGLRAAFDIARGFFDKAEAIDLSKDFGKATKKFLLGAMKRLFDNNGAEEIGQTIASAINFALEWFYTTFEDGKVSKKFRESIVTVINTAIENIKEEDLAKGFGALLTVISDLFGAIGDLNLSDLGDKIVNAINEQVDNGNLEKAVKNIAGAFINLASAIINIITKIDWSGVATAIRNGIVDAIKKDPDGAEKTADALAFIFKLVAAYNAAKLGLNVLGKALILKLSGALAGSGAASTIASSLGGVITSAISLISLPVLAIPVAIADLKGLYDTIAKIGSDLARKLNFKDAIKTSVFHKLFDADNLNDYLIKLSGIDRAYKNLNGDISDAKNFLELLKTKGMESTTEYKKLADAIKEYEKTPKSIFGGGQKALDEVYKACGDVEVAVTQSYNYVETATDSQIKSLESLFDSEELKGKAKQSGINHATNYKDGVTNTISTNSSPGKSLDPLWESIKNKGTSSAKNAGKSNANSYINNTKSNIKAGTGDISNTTKNLFGDVKKNANSSANNAGKSLGGSTNKGVKTGVKPSGGVSSALKEMLKGASSGAKSTATNQGTSLGNSEKSGITSSLKNYGTVKTSLDGLVKNASSGASSTAKTKGSSIGSNLVKGVISGINSMVERAKSAIGGLVSKLIEKFEDDADINSPSKVFAKLGVFIPQGVAQGIESDNSIDSAMKNMTDDMISQFDTDSIDLSKLIDTTRFSDLFKNILEQSDKFKSQLSSNLSNMNMRSLQAQLAVNPSIKASQYRAVADNNQDAIVENLLKSMYVSQRGQSNQSSNNKMINCTLELGGQQLAKFVIDTVRGNVMQTGGF